MTALCYDLVGSTDLLVQSDVEDFDELIQAFQQRAGHAVISHGASLRETGDGGVALFPIEIDARDAASVAINAGLEIVEACARVGREKERADVHVRVGIATSMGLVRDRPEKPSPDNVTAVALAMASRLQTIAEPDTVVVSQQTRVLAGRSHAFSFQGVRHIKGMAEPERVWQALSHRVEVGRFYAFGRLVIPTVGRAAELATIAECWRAAAAAHGNVVLIEGEAGIGKSRLLHDIRRMTRRERGRMLLFQCWPSGSYSTLHPLRQNLPGADGRTGVRPRTSEIAELFARHGVDDAAVIDVFSYLLGAEDVPTGLADATPAEIEESTRRAVRRALEQLCRRGPVIIAVEDVHWIDPTSQRLLIEIASAIGTLPVLIVLTTRPETNEEFWPIANLKRIRLAGLEEGECRSAVAAMWPVSRSAELPKLLDLVCRITAGVPLFIEEICHWMAENPGLASEQLAQAHSSAGPSVLESVLGARLAPLGAARRVARAAAVVGHRSNIRLLAELLPELGEEGVVEALEQLVEAGLLVRVRSSGETLIAFRHALIQETIYNASLRKTREALHGRLVATLERDGAIAPWIGIDALADHSERAGLIDKAISHYVAAGKESSARSALAEARHLLERAVELCERIGESGERDKLVAFVALGPVVTSTEGSGSQRARKVYEEGVEIARRRPVSERSEWFPIYWGWWFTGQDLENKRAQAILDELKDVEDSEVQLQIRHCIWAVDFYLGRHASCIAAVDAGMPLYDPGRGRDNFTLFGGHDTKVCGLAHRGLSLWLTGRPASALRSVAEARDWAEQTGHVASITHALINQAALNCFRRDFEALRRVVAEIHPMAEEHRLRSLAATIEILGGWAEGNIGDLARGKEMIRRGLAVHAELETPEDYPVWCSMLVELMERTGEHSEGLALLASAEEQAEKSGHRYWLAELSRRRARLVYAKGGDDDAVCAALVKSLDTASGQNAVPLLLEAYDTLVHLGLEVASHYRERAERDRAQVEPGEALVVNVEAPPRRRVSLPPA